MPTSYAHLIPKRPRILPLLNTPFGVLKSQREGSKIRKSFGIITRKQLQGDIRKFVQI